MLQERAIVDLGIVDQQHRRIEELAEIVRRDRCRHSDRDPARAVGEQVREQAREYLRLLLLAIVGRTEVDGAFVEPRHQLRRDRGQPRLGVAVGGGIIAIDVAEIALPVDERIPKREILREADHRVVDRLVAVRMIFTDDVADDAGGLLVGAGGIEPEKPHRPQQPAVDGLQPVADVGQRPRRDRRQRIDEVALRQRGVERGFDDGGKVSIGHASCLARRYAAIASRFSRSVPPRHRLRPSARRIVPRTRHLGQQPFAEALHLGHHPALGSGKPANTPMPRVDTRSGNRSISRPEATSPFHSSGVSRANALPRHRRMALVSLAVETNAGTPEDIVVGSNAIVAEPLLPPIVARVDQVLARDVVRLQLSSELPLGPAMHSGLAIGVKFDLNSS